ncbi:MAG: 16S rRNA (cytidine(1402)-2'-O)-methyltransferase [Clostridia bacterium]|nr:16S rRNA (cytidine(1402)-2'-O)-methyltransferase [Clostridia bacterium]
MSGKLIIVGTPIGNLSDFSSRGIETLKNVDFIAAEDTRVTLKLLNHFEIKKPLISYHQHNYKARGEFILKRILSGESCALVSDAGMPAISDPGEKLVSLCHINNVSVTVVPGPSALTAAIAISGFPSGRFTFEGFLSVNKKNRHKHLQELKYEPRTMIFYEAPHKLINTLTDLYEALGDRKIAIVKEITKIHEQVRNTSLAQAILYCEKNPPKGEIVLIVGGNKADPELLPHYSLSDALSITNNCIKEGATPTEAAKTAAKITGINKSEIYRAFIADKKS